VYEEAPGFRFLAPVSDTVPFSYSQACSLDWFVPTPTAIPLPNGEDEPTVPASSCNAL